MMISLITMLTISNVHFVHYHPSYYYFIYTIYEIYLNIMGLVKGAYTRQRTILIPYFTSTYRTSSSSKLYYTPELFKSNSPD